MIRLAVILLLVACAQACFGNSVMIGSFSYYKDRSPESVVDEITLNGFDDVRIVGCTKAAIPGDLVKAFNDAERRVWLHTFANGVYGTTGLPEGWESWRMKLRKTKDHASGFIFFCPNNPDYRAWKKNELVSSLKAYKFYGVEMSEPLFPAYLGPESPDYGCLCDNCEAAFKKMYPSAPGIPDFENPQSPRFWKTDKALYNKWIEFRVASIVNHLDDIINGKGGIREMCPSVKVCTWSLGLDTPDQIAKLREWEALDTAAIVRRTKPDFHMIQTDWPDWIKADLPSDYVLKYKPVADSIRAVSPGFSIHFQTDIGSLAQMRRSRKWMRELEVAAKKIGIQHVTYYEYFLGDFIYTEPPMPLKAAFEKPGIIKISFNKRLAPDTATNTANYAIDSGRINSATVDGNIVRLSVSETKSQPTVTVSGLSDDEKYRFFHDKPPCIMTDSQRVTVDK